MWRVMEYEVIACLELAPTPRVSVSRQVSQPARQRVISSRFVGNSVIAVASESQQDGERLQPTNDEEECQGNVMSCVGKQPRTLSTQLQCAVAIGTHTSL
jgi:hypothetical protein